jgi:hypothetical protein
MGAKSRRKGKVGEREVANLAKGYGFGEAKRGAPMQAAGGETLADVCEVGRLWIEAKRYKRTPVNGFARKHLARERPGFISVLSYRDDHQPEPYAVLKLSELLKMERAALHPTLTDVVRQANREPCPCMDPGCFKGPDTEEDILAVAEEMARDAAAAALESKGDAR